MRLTNSSWWGFAGVEIAVLMLMTGLLGAARMGCAQGISTTTVQGTVYLANGEPASGTLVVSWPAFTTAAGQSVAADKTTVTIAADGFVSVNLAPNQGAIPAGLYYTAVFYLSDGTVNTQYRRRHAAQLFGVFDGVVHQFAAEWVSDASGSCG